MWPSSSNKLAIIVEGGLAEKHNSVRCLFWNVHVRLRHIATQSTARNKSISVSETVLVASHKEKDGVQQTTSAAHPQFACREGVINLGLIYIIYV